MFAVAPPPHAGTTQARAQGGKRLPQRHWERVALIEGVVINLSQARREVDLGQGVASLEGACGDFGEALRQADTPQGGAAEEDFSEELVHVADVRFLQGRASTECTGVQSPQCGREFNLSQRGASVEGSRMDAHDSLRQGDGGELLLVDE